MHTASRLSIYLTSTGSFDHDQCYSRRKLKASSIPSPMAFFQGASNIKINGGEFNEVRGNYVVYDLSRHQSNVNSFNTTTRTVVDSGNNNSSVYHGVAENTRHPDPPNRGANRGRLGSRDCRGTPLSMHPALMQPQYLPPGSRTQNFDSFNTRNETMVNANNDNSTEHGIPARRIRGRHGRRSGIYREEDQDEGDSVPRGLGSTLRSPLTHRSRYGPDAFPTTSTAQFSPGQMQGMSPEFQKTFDTLMKQVQKETAPEPAEEEHSDEESSEEEEEEDPRMAAPHSISTGMSNLSLDENRPPYSRVKSDPQNPYHPFSASPHTASPYNPDNARPSSVPVLPEHMQQPFVMPPNPTAPTSGPYAAYAPPPIPSWNGRYQAPAATPVSPEHQSGPPPSHSGTPYAAPHAPQGEVNAAYGDFAMPPPPPPPPQPRPSGPVFNTINGDYTKVDQSVHSTNIGSGNTTHTLIQDSYNDNSVKSYAKPASRPRWQGRIRSVFH